MSEKRFLSCVITEGIFLLISGLFILLIPKVSELSFGFALCLAFFAVGGYKIINAFGVKNYSGHYILDIVTGLLMIGISITLFFIPMLNVMMIISLIGVYFLLQSISSFAFAIQTKGSLIIWWANIFPSCAEFVCAIITITTLSAGALWFSGVLTALDFILAGIIKVFNYIATKYIRTFDQM